MSLTLEIRRLSQRDILGSFSAGTAPDELKLNEFFQRYAKQNEARKMSATFVAWAGDRIAGFVTIVPGTVDPSRITEHVKGLSRHSAPVLVLARMATDASFQKQGVGRQLMREVVLVRAVALADGYGCVGVYVDPKPDAVTFYQNMGFLPLPVPTQPAPMFLALKKIQATASRPPG